MIARRAVPDEDHVSRFVPYSRQDRDADGVYLGLTAAACKMRDADQGGLSVTWIEHFGPYGPASKQAAAVAYRETLRDRRLPPNAAFAYAQVSVIKAAAQDYDRTIRVVWDPVEGNQGHSEVRHFTDDDIRLLDLLATEVFGDVDIVRNMKLPPA